MDKDRLRKQIEFIVEVDKLKNIYSGTLLMDGSRNENDAEHFWHLALMAMVLKEYSPEKDLDITKVLKMLLVHDLVEIYAGIPLLRRKGNLDKASRNWRRRTSFYSILPRIRTGTEGSVGRVEARKTPRPSLRLPWTDCNL